MANVIQHPQMNIHPHPVNHAPAPFGFGFGLSNSNPMVSTWPTPSPGFPSTSFASPTSHPFPSSFSGTQQTSSRPQKRGREPDDDQGRRDEAMDRSPTPERPKRSVPKRARTTPQMDLVAKDDKNSKENKPSALDQDDVDIGVLLASLPQEALLPLLTSLVQLQPSLKRSILPLIPRPTIETAMRTLATSSKKLQDAYPYSTPTSFSQPTFGFASSSSGFGSHRSPSSFGSLTNSNSNAGSMRESYITSRLRPHINDFVAAFNSYLPYFSSAPPSSDNQLEHPLGNRNTAQSHSSALQILHKDKNHPSETYLFLAAITTHFFAQPPLTQSCLVPILASRLSNEWMAWVESVHVRVNQMGGMFGSETVRSWVAGLDSFADEGTGTKDAQAVAMMREIRDRWVAQVGWLVGRNSEHAMQQL